MPKLIKNKYFALAVAIVFLVILNIYLITHEKNRGEFFKSAYVDKLDDKKDLEELEKENNLIEQRNIECNKKITATRKVLNQNFEVIKKVINKKAKQEITSLHSLDCDGISSLTKNEYQEGDIFIHAEMGYRCGPTCGWSDVYYYQMREIGNEWKIIEEFLKGRLVF